MDGYFEKTIDGKGRVSLQREMVLEMGDELVVAPWPERCVAVMHPDQHREIADQLYERGFTDPRIRAAARLFCGNAAKLKADPQNRLVLPEYLRTFAGLGSEAVLIGAGRHAEIWDKKRYQEYMEAHLADPGSESDLLSTTFAQIEPQSKGTPGASGNDASGAHAEAGASAGR